MKFDFSDLLVWCAGAIALLGVSAAAGCKQGVDPSAEPGSGGAPADTGSASSTATGNALPGDGGVAGAPAHDPGTGGLDMGQMPQSSTASGGGAAQKEPPGASSCGDGLCSPDDGELCTTCAQDCASRDTRCGNGECQPGEASASCQADCGPNPWPSAWAELESAVVAEINRHRLLGSPCPQSSYLPLGSPLTMQPGLRKAARLHAHDLSFSGYSGHFSCNGRSPMDRALAQGESMTAEVVGVGAASPKDIVAAWRSSEGHCQALMAPEHSEIGVGVAEVGARQWVGMLR